MWAADRAASRAANLDPSQVVSLEVDGHQVTVRAGSNLLEACAAAGCYVPRLCYHPGLGCACPENGAADNRGAACGLCQVRMADGLIVLACRTLAESGARVTTDDAGLRDSRRQKLAALLDRHPHICLSCPDRDGCAREECVFGHPEEARCCAEFGRCEFGMVAAFVDPKASVRRRAVAAPRAAIVEGQIRREPGLCVGCGRCVRVCSRSSATGEGALEMAVTEAGPAARPKGSSLRDSGCTFCGLCVMVCPTGATTAPGPEGVRWLAARRERRSVAQRVLPPKKTADRLAIPDDLGLVPSGAGILTLFDAKGQVLRIAGVPDLAQGLLEVLRQSATAGAVCFAFESDPMYTQRETELLAQYAREHGHLPLGNDLGDDLFEEEE